MLKNIVNKFNQEQLDLLGAIKYIDADIIEIEFNSSVKDNSWTTYLFTIDRDGECEAEVIKHYIGEGDSHYIDANDLRFIKSLFDLF